MAIWTSSFILVFAGLYPTECALRFANSFGDHMVLQRAPKSAHIYGFADVAGDTLVVRKNGVDVGQTTVITHPRNDYRGMWKFKLPPEGNQGPHTISVTSSNGDTVAINDVLFGDVWLCSGQSNMRFTMAEVYNSALEIKKALKYTSIRMLYTNPTQADSPVHDVSVNNSWVRPKKGIIDKFSALCFMYGREIQRQLYYPIGLILSSYGGTPVEAWSSPDALQQCPNPGSTLETFGPNDPSVLWNSMIHPYLNMTIKGVIWYQGESNSKNPSLYACQFPAMISDWRQKFFTGTDGATDQNFPFGFVQLAPHRPWRGIGGYPATRWAQTANVGYVPNDKMTNTFMAVAADLPDFTSPSGSIHPRHKRDIAARLVLGAMNVAYGLKHVPFQGPFPTRYLLDTETDRLEITFDNGTADMQLRALHGFEICCADSKTSNCSGNATWENASILQGLTSSVHVNASVCPDDYVPAGVRYIWSESPCRFKKCPLYGKLTHLPVPPFIRTGGFETKTSSPASEYSQTFVGRLAGLYQTIGDDS